ARRRRPPCARARGSRGRHGARPAPPASGPARAALRASPPECSGRLPRFPAQDILSRLRHLGASMISQAASNAVSVLFLEVNEAEKYFLEKFVAEGKLPHFARLLEQGVFC